MYQPSYTIFVRNIPITTDAKELAQVFLQFGEISLSRIISTTFRGQAVSSGFGFVDFKTQEAYDKAINNKTPITIKGENGEQTLIVTQARPPRPRDTIFLGNLAETTNEENIREVFKGFNIAQIRIPQPITPTQNRKFFAFVKFISCDDYNRAIALENVTINGKQIKILSARRPNNNICFRRRTNHDNDDDDDDNDNINNDINDNNNNNDINDDNNNNDINDNDINSHHRIPRRRVLRRPLRRRGRLASNSAQNKEEEKKEIVHGSYEIFVGDIPVEASKEDVMNSLIHYNPTNIVEFGNSNSKNFAIIRLRSKEDSMNAISQNVSINGASCRVFLARYNQRKRNNGLRRAPP